MTLPTPERRNELESTPVLAFRDGLDHLVLFHTHNGRWTRLPNDKHITAARDSLVEAPALVREVSFDDYQPFSMTVDIFPAARCNMACSYCVNGGGNLDGSRAMMTEELARQTVVRIRELAKEQGLKRLQVTLYGGEPLLNRDATRLMVREFLAFDEPRTFVNLKTNGTIFDEEVFAMMREHPERAIVWLSMDGDEDAHNAKRTYPTGQPTYHRVLATHARLLEMGITPSVTAVIGHPYNFVDAVQSLAKAGIRKINVKPVKRAVYGNNAVKFTYRADDFDKQYQAYNAFALNCDAPRLLDREGRVKLFNFLFRHGFDDASSCGVGSFRLGVYADGTFYPCPNFAGDEAFALGDVAEGLDWTALNKFRDSLRTDGSTPANHADCVACTARLTCAGGCFAENQEKRGNIGAIDTTRCDEKRTRLLYDLAFWIAQPEALRADYEVPASRYA